MSVYVVTAALVSGFITFSGARSAAAQTEVVRILALGDSLTAGFGLPATDAFPSQLEAALTDAGHAVKVLNAGVSGDTSAGGRARLAWALGDKPDVLIVELGANDGLRGIDPKVTYSNLDSIIVQARAKGVSVLLTGMRAPPNLGREYGSEFDAVFPRLAEKHGVAFFPFFLEGVAAEPHLNQADGIHPNRRGVEIIVGNILPHMTRLLDQVSAARRDTASDVKGRKSP